MKKFIKLTALISALVMAVFCFAACGSAPETNPEDSAAPSASADASTSEGGMIAKIKEKGKLTVLTEAGFAPFEYIDTNNNIVGLDVEISQAIADKLGVELDMVSMDFDGLIAAVQSGKGDIVAAGLTANEERAKSVDFSVNYIDTGLYIIVKDGDDTIKSKDDIVAGVSCGVQTGTTSDLYVTDNTEAEASRYKTVADAVVALQSGKINAVICDKLPAEDAVANNSDLKLLDEPLTVEQYALAIAKGDSEFMDLINEVLKDMLDSGKIEELLNKHIEAAREIGA